MVVEQDTQNGEMVEEQITETADHGPRSNEFNQI